MKYANDIVRNKNNPTQNLKNYQELTKYFDGILNLLAEKNLDWTNGPTRTDIKTDTILKDSEDLTSNINKFIDTINNNTYGAKIKVNEDGRPSVIKGYFNKSDEDMFNKFIEKFYNLITFVKLSFGDPINDSLPTNESSFMGPVINEGGYTLIIDVKK